MSITTKMIVPGFTGGVVFTARTGTSYTSDANGIITVSPADVGNMLSCGCVVMPERPVVTLGTSGYIAQGAINVIPSSAGSTVSYTYILAAPSVLGVTTTIQQPVASTAVSTVTSSGSNISTATVLSWSSAASIDLTSIGSTLYQIANRGVVASSVVTLSPASS